MKNLITVGCMVFMIIVSHGQNENKLFQLSNHWGGFGGVNITINPKSNISLSGEGAWIFRNFYLGGFGLSSDYGSVYSSEKDQEYNLKRSSGGLMLGAFSNNERLFSLYTEVKIGFGDVLLRTQLSPNVYEEFEANTTTITPSLGICITPKEFVQFRIFGGYEHNSDFQLIGIGNDKMNGAIFGIGLYLGYF